MTRVSDQAAFAAAVAAQGGLPFIALALMGGEDTRALLVETAERLGDAPWGVGILGFVPDEIRAAQLEAVHEVRPPYALIAGGRPAHARPLEAAGIATFLHAPSPALLERFLASGARRFVFEGSECGGHVGPRAAFPLWEQQIQRLVDFGAEHGCAAEIDVLFAGGVHDARSAAMVSAAAAPLVAAGGAAGVLMGTAYLFTREAVTTGAIVPAFQRAAVACDRTVLLATAPGHATRCADGTFVATFNATREARLAAGVPA
jgi:NAD(P)H-dependent flavin oxidoreductase YrpB (nitropropane dioxygenase family)